MFNFTGTVSVTTGEIFTAGHDNGLTRTIGGVTVIDAPGPTGFAVTTETYAGLTGNEPFQLVYGECCGAPADLDLVPPVSPALSRNLRRSRFSAARSSGSARSVAARRNSA